MTERIELQLREALDEYTQAVEPEPDGWERIEQRIASGRRRPSGPAALLVAAVAVVLLIALSVAVLLNGRVDDSSTRAGFSGPRRIVTHVDGDLALVDTTSRDVIRVLAPFLDEPSVASSPSVSPDGRSVYFSRLAGQCDAGGGPEIVSVPLSGGSPRLFATGVIPSISPDGKFIAIVGPQIADPCGRTAALTIWDRATHEKILDHPTVYTSINLVGWSPDSRRIRYLGMGGDGSVRQASELDVAETAADVAATPRKLEIPLGAPSVTLGTSGLVAVAENDDQLQGFRIVVADPDRPGKERTLVSDPTRHVITLDADPTGRHLLYWTGSNTGPYELWRLTIGEQPVLVRRQQPGTGVEPEAVWVP